MLTRRPAMTARLSTASRCLRDDRQHFLRGAVGRLLVPAHRTEWSLQHATHPHRLRPEMKRDRPQVQFALRLRGAVALAQIIEPGRTMITLGPQFGIGNVARDRPAIGAVALP